MPDPAPDDTDRQRDPAASPLNPLPAAVWALLVPLAGVELVLLAAAQGWIGGPAGLGWRIAAIQRLAFVGEVQAWMLETRHAPPRQLLRYLAYPWVQPGSLAALFALALVAGLGKAVAEGLGTRVLLVVALAAPALAALVFGLIMGGHELAWLIGAVPLMMGLVGAYTWMLWARAAGDPARQRRAFGLIGALMLARLGFGLLAETGYGWIADLAAFGAGFGLAWALHSGRFAMLRDRLRQRG